MPAGLKRDERNKDFIIENETIPIKRVKAVVGILENARELRSESAE